MIFIFFHYNQFTVFCQFSAVQHGDPVTHTCIHFFLTLSCSIISDQTQFPVLHSRISLLIHSKVLKHKINGNHPPPQKKGRKEKHRINWKTRFKMAINTYPSIITLNVNGLNAPIKRHRVADWIKKQKPSICCHKKLALEQRTCTD